MRRPIKAHLVNRSNRPVNLSNRYEPIELSFRPNRTGILVPDPGGLAGPVGN